MEKTGNMKLQAPGTDPEKLRKPSALVWFWFNDTQQWLYRGFLNLWLYHFIWAYCFTELYKKAAFPFSEYFRFLSRFILAASNIFGKNLKLVDIQLL